MEQVVTCQHGGLSNSGVEQELLCIPAEAGKILTTGVLAKYFGTCT